MLTSIRDYPASAAILKDEARFGLDWLVKMWDPYTRTLYYQVGIGDGSSKIVADHDLLRLPEKDDELDVKEGDKKFYIKYRPLFRAAEGGAAISPNLAGRMAAAFALGAQIWADEDKDFAEMLSSSAEQIFALADTSHQDCEVDDEVLLTTAPWDYYGESEWCSDMELGASALHSLTGKSSYLEAAKEYASMYASYYKGVQHFNLYDVAALAHAHLFRQLPASDPVRDTILANLKAGLSDAQAASDDDVFGLGMRYKEDADAVPEILGLAVTGLLYDDLTGQDHFNAFAQRQLDFALGANGWGVSFVIGAAGDIKTGTFPKCPQHNVDNLMGLPAGNDRMLLGAVVDGPSTDTQEPSGEGFWNDCPAKGSADPYKQFTRSKWSFSDNADNWAGTEPADDYTAMSVILWARLMIGKAEQALTHNFTPVASVLV